MMGAWGGTAVRFEVRSAQQDLVAVAASTSRAAWLQVGELRRASVGRATQILLRVLLGSAWAAQAAPELRTKAACVVRGTAQQ